MWTEGVGMIRRGTPRHARRPGILGMIVFSVLLGGCGDGGAATADRAADAPAVTTAAPEPGSSAGPAGLGVAQQVEYRTVADLFPEGEGRTLVMNNCATCHAVACAAMGQRSEGRWRELDAAHAAHLPGLPDEQRRLIFAYLSSNFGEAQPEPAIPAAFLDRGCTPF